ncbi:VWA domain-containing protein [Rhodococcus rhodochrous]|uniref:VWA domain-containing protein n=1 Tax=Rhodococcus rhodochrous TaxID=1829 RepID=UPI001E353526|nr:VWA domain-containing protein [Rhodococcus rhodochrous]MCD2099205.1 VWA domain-containing protein [Rhodococcus rhodochrous]MCD2120616.1 VWA domain-containing protein [Rhodococcus rhodochrous]MCQ4136096.1 VWA domain-containing protein [Rhodococcus rhodochrous]MDJ0017482.1 VWA domain-containing protein [Rhodococcus rhodochrous]
MYVYPFGAVVGSDDLALALTLCAVSPTIGGVLVRGEKGTAKSTTVRAHAALLPPVTVVDGCRFSCDPDAPDPSCPDGPHPADTASHVRPVRLVELPVGAAEDRVTGALHLGKALADRTAEYEPGLLALAHRGVLYVDEVNLLHDHLVDLLLDAAAMGRSTVERDGVSVEHASRFVLVGTMNPEEGELRPQLLDRFGLAVDVTAPRDPHVRAEIVRRRMAFDADPAGFTARWAERDAEWSRRVVSARELAAQVVLSDDALVSIAEVCAAFDVDGMRADLVTARTAIAHAAWHDRREVTREDIAAAARLALPHRRRRNPFDAPTSSDDLLDELLGGDDPDPGPDDDPGGGESAPDDSAAETSSGSGDRSSTGLASASDPFRATVFSVDRVGRGAAGRRSRAVTTIGRTVGSRRGDSGPVHLPATIRATAFADRDRQVRRKIIEGRETNLVLLCVDASGSMAARNRMVQVKTAVLSLLLDAYRRRDTVGLVTFRGTGATLALPPTNSVDVAAARLRELPTGGRTPLAEGLIEAAETIRRHSLRDPRRRALLVVVTDGRATAGTDAVQRSLDAADTIAAHGVSSVVVDSETGRFRMGLAARLAERLGADYIPVGEVDADALTGIVRERAA